MKIINDSNIPGSNILQSSAKSKDNQENAYSNPEEEEHTQKRIRNISRDGQQAHDYTYATVQPYLIPEPTTTNTNTTDSHGNKCPNKAPLSYLEPTKTTPQPYTSRKLASEKKSPSNAQMSSFPPPYCVPEKAASMRSTQPQSYLIPMADSKKGSWQKNNSMPQLCLERDS